VGPVKAERPPARFVKASCDYAARLMGVVFIVPLAQA